VRYAGEQKADRGPPSLRFSGWKKKKKKNHLVGFKTGGRERRRERRPGDKRDTHVLW
jgi:hypothetical protein